MNSHAYAARSTRNYWPWVGGAALLLALLIVGWSTFAASPDAPVAAAPPTPPLRQLEPRRALPPVQTVPAAEPAGVPGAEEAALKARVSQLEADLEAQRVLTASIRESLALAGAQIKQLSDDNDRMRTAIESATGGAAAPSRLARKSNVRHIGEPSLTPLGAAWVVTGQWLNVGNAEAHGTAEIQLLVDGRPAGSVETVRIGPFAPGATAPYQVRFNPSFESQGHVILASARWRDD